MGCMSSTVGSGFEVVAESPPRLDAFHLLGVVVPMRVANREGLDLTCLAAVAHVAVAAAPVVVAATTFDATQLPLRPGQAVVRFGNDALLVIDVKRARR